MKSSTRSASIWSPGDWVGIAAIGLALAFIYWPLRHAGFVWNDSDYVTSAGLSSFAGLGRIWFKLGATEQYYPLLHSFFWLQHLAYGDSAAAHHAMGVLLHGVDACLAAAVLRTLLPRAAPEWPYLPWFAALLFVVHPVMVESVAWISEQKNTLSTLFYLGALGWYLRFDERRTRRGYLIATGLFVCALLAKTVTATLPGAAGLLIWWRRGELQWQRDLLPLIPWCVLGATAGLFTAYVEHTYLGAGGTSFAFGLSERLLVAGRAVWFYAGKLMWPAHIMFIYPRWTLTGSAAQWLFPLGVFAFSALLWAVRNWSRAPLTCWLFFVGSLFPILGFLNVYAFIFSFVADHFQYLGSLGLLTGFAALVCSAAFRLPRAGRAAVAVAATALLLALGIQARRETTPYRDVEEFYRTGLARNPQSWMAWNNLGLIAYGAGDKTTAIADYRRALAIYPDSPEGRNNLGVALSDFGRWAEAESEFRLAITQKSPFPQAEFNLVRVYQAEGRWREAEAVARDVLRFLPESPAVHIGLGNVLQGEGRNREAVAEYRIAQQLSPDNAEAFNNEGGSLTQLGDTDAALADFERAVLLNANYADAHYNLGVALVRKARIHEAIEQLTIANRLDPDRADVYREIGDVLQRSGHAAEAARFFRLGDEAEAKHQPTTAIASHL